MTRREGRQRRERLTNTDIVMRLMSYGNPMKQIIVMTAIEKYAEMCLQKPAEYFDSPMLSGEGWLRGCRELLSEYHELLDRGE